jgi:regulatory protein
MSEYNNILSRAANLCSSGEKCQNDIKQKLLIWGLNEEETETALRYLIDNKFIDEKRYTNFFVRDKLKINKWGRIKIAYALRNKKIDQSIIDSTFNEIDQELYMETLYDLVVSKIKSLGNIKTAANKARLFRYAAQRGFTSEEIYTVLKKIESV